jgi:TIR domain
MTDVFVSYASEDRERAGQLAQALGARGWSVWWDRKIIAGQAFDQAIERELETAHCVVVLWSAHSIDSEWVKNEAAVAAERGVLIPALIDGVRLPLEFRRKQTADLVNWHGEAGHAGLEALCEGVAHVLGTAAPQPMVAGRRSQRPRWLWPAAAALAVSLGLGLYAGGARRAPPPTQASEVAAVPPPASSGQPPERAPPAAQPTVSPAEAPAPPAAEAPGLADLVVGRYHGDVIADSKGSSRSDITVTITRIDRATVRVSSDYRRIGSVDVNLTRNGNQVFAADGDTPFIVDLDRSPPSLVFDPHSELAYRGTRRP